MAKPFAACLAAIMWIFVSAIVEQSLPLSKSSFGVSNAMASSAKRYLRSKPVQLTSSLNRRAQIKRAVTLPQEEEKSNVQRNRKKKNPSFEKKSKKKSC